MSAPAVAAARTRVGVGALWRFSRPHTIVGTTLSVLGIAVIAGDVPAYDVAGTLLAALAVNVFIVGVNQITDVAIDRVNKPLLPLASGELTMAQGRAIVAVAGVLPVALALSQGGIEVVSVSAALVIGAAYSLPPLRLKRYPALAAASISIVRAVVVNLGIYAHFADGGQIAPSVWALTVFVLPFSFAIAVLKDVPDAEGDRRFAIHTFTVRLGGRAVFRMGMAALTIAYVGMAVFGADDANHAVLAATHLAALALLWFWAARVDLADFTPFYMRVWGLFFLEYLIVPVAVLAG